MAGPLPARPRVVDIGCGTGPATLTLARLTGGDVTGVDTHEPFLARLRADADAAGLGDRVRTLAAPMLRAEHPGHDAALDEVGAEIGVRAAHGTDYGYTGYVLIPRTPAPAGDHDPPYAGVVASAPPYV